MDKLASAKDACAACNILPHHASEKGIKINQDGVRRTALDMFSYPDVNEENVQEIWPELASIPKEVLRQVSYDARYAQYIRRQNSDVEAMRRDASQIIPDGFSYATVVGLSNEVRSKLEASRPATLGQAGRIEGMTPAALTLILMRLRQTDRKKTG